MAFAVQAYNDAFVSYNSGCADEGIIKKIRRHLGTRKNFIVATLEGIVETVSGVATAIMKTGLAATTLMIRKDWRERAWEEWRRVSNNLFITLNSLVGAALYPWVAVRIEGYLHLDFKVVEIQGAP